MVLHVDSAGFELHVVVRADLFDRLVSAYLTWMSPQGMRTYVRATGGPFPGQRAALYGCRHPRQSVGPSEIEQIRVDWLAVVGTRHIQRIGEMEVAADGVQVRVPEADLQSHDLAQHLRQFSLTPIQRQPQPVALPQRHAVTERESCHGPAFQVGQLVLGLAVRRQGVQEELGLLLCCCLPWSPDHGIWCSGQETRANGPRPTTRSPDRIYRRRLGQETEPNLVCHRFRARPRAQVRLCCCQMAEEEQEHEQEQEQECGKAGLP